VAFRKRDAPVAIGYLGADTGVANEVEAVLSDSDRYRLREVSVDEFLDESGAVDGLLVDTAALTDPGEDLVAALDTDRPVLAVGPGRECTVSARTAPFVDAFVSLTAPEEVHATLDSVFEERLRNLGMSASELLDVIFESVPVHLYLKDRDGRHLRWSEYYRQPDDTLGKTDREIISDEAFAQQAYDDDQRVVSSGEAIIEKAEYNPDAEDWSLTSKVPVYDGDDVVGLLGATLLITQRKEYEEQLERQKERLEEFAGIISHDLRNPLTVAQGRIELARDRYSENSNLAVANKHLDRMDDLIDEVLTMTREGEDVEETEIVALERIAEQCWESVATGGAALVVEGDYRFHADGGRLRHVFENLFRNAIEHATPDDHSQDVGGGNRQADDGVSVSVGPLTDEDTATQPTGFYVADDGPGIPEDEREDVFDHGYTTSDGGTGLGLKIVRQVVEAHGWSITVTESADGGARFEIRGVEPAE